MLTASGTFFKTSAEASYRYLKDKFDFDEAHTALDDATIETYILSQVAKKHAISIGIIFFPFRELGTTDEFVMRRKTPDAEEVGIVIDAIQKYLSGKTASNYTARLENIVARLNEYLG